MSLRNRLRKLEQNRRVPPIGPLLNQAAMPADDMAFCEDICRRIREKLGGAVALRDDMSEQEMDRLRGIFRRYGLTKRVRDAGMR